MADWKNSVNLPRTDFPMKANLQVAEPAAIARWEAMDLYGEIARARAGRPKYVLHDGPPYANGQLHILRNITASMGSPYDVAFDRNGNAWVSGGSGVEQFDANGLSLMTYPLPAANLLGIVVDADGNKWIAHRNAAPSSISRTSSNGSESGETGDSSSGDSSDTDTETDPMTSTSLSGSASATSPTTTSNTNTTATTADTEGDTDTDTDTGGATPSDGCSCTTDTSGRSLPTALLGLLFLGALRRRRRA